MKHFISVLSASMLLWVTTSQSAEAQRPLRSLRLSGLTVSCQTARGQQVPIYLDDSQYQNIGRAGFYNNNPRQPFIAISPTWLNQVPYQAAVFWFYHECAHVNLPMGVGTYSQAAEINADCWALNRMAAHGLVRSGYDVNAIAATILPQRGSPMGHLPGPARMNAMLRCLR
ncbi:MAG: hypothetical protein AB3N28_15070 [Kordiimonas sp.]